MGPLGLPPKGRLCVRTDMYHHAKFHADRVTVAEMISVTGQIERYQELQCSPNLISDKSHTSVAFVDNYFTIGPLLYIMITASGRVLRIVRQ